MARHVTSAVASEGAPAGEPGISLRDMPPLLLGAIMLTVLLRAVMGALLGLTDDEAYYRLWTLAPALSYYDHPPMAAWMSVLTRAVAGDTALGLRLPSVLISLVGPLLLWRTAGILFGRRVAITTVAFSLVMPLLAVGGIIITPDAPSVFFWGLVAWAMAELHVSRNANWWLAIGLFAGCGMISKYTNLFAGAGLLMWVLLIPRNRRFLLSWQLWAGGLVAALCTLPVVIWNAQHQWASFAKQFGRVTRGADLTPVFTAEMLGGFVGLASPVIGMLALIGFARVLAEAVRQRDERAILIMSGLFPMLIYFFVHALHARVQANWLAPLYPALALCAAYQLAMSSSAHKQRWFVAAIVVGAVLTGLVYVHALRPFVVLPGARDPTSQLRGWSEVAAEVERQRRAHGAGWIATAGYGATGQLDFALRGQVKVEQVTERIRYVHLPPVDSKLARSPAIVFDEDDHLALQVARAHFRSVVPLGQVVRSHRGVIFATYDLYLATDPLNPERIFAVDQARR